MTYIPDCRTDEYYNEKYLSDKDKEFVAGYDYAVEQILNLFNNLDVYPKLEELLTDNKAVLCEGKVGIAKEAIEEWAEADRDELITSMIDCMDEAVYAETKKRVDQEETKKEEEE